MNVLITHITRYVNVDALSDYAVDWMLYYTHHSNMDAPQYVHVDALSVSAVAWMSYYTHHSNMAAPQYVHADVS